MPGSHAVRLTPEPGRILCRSWPEPVVVTGIAAAVEGPAEVPEAIAGEVARAPFEGHHLPSSIDRVPAARALLVALAAAASNPRLGELPPAPRRGIVVGTWTAAINEVIGFIEECNAVGPALVNPGLFPFTVMNAAAGLAAIEIGCAGPNVTLNNGPTSALDAIAQGADLVSRGLADLVLAGGFESWSPKSNRPFDRRSPPATLAAVLALARRDDAVARGASIGGRLLSFAAGELPEAAAEACRAEVVGAARRAAEALLPGGGTPATQAGLGPLSPPDPASPEATLLELLAAVRRLEADPHSGMIPVVAGGDGATAAAVVFGPMGENDG